jgi:uncharacterized protein
MPLSLYQASVPVYVKCLGGLGAMIDKAVSSAEAHNYPPGNLFTARLFPDMWSFSEQVRAATNHAFRGTARLAGLPIPEIADNGSDIDEMRARIAATVEFLQSVDPEAVEAGLTREVTFPRGKETITMTGEDYFLSFTLPNFYFHLATAYNLLRHNGVPVSKVDFLGET